MGTSKPVSPAWSNRSLRMTKDDVGVIAYIFEAAQNISVKADRYENSMGQEVRKGLYTLPRPIAELEEKKNFKISSLTRGVVLPFSNCESAVFQRTSDAYRDKKCINLSDS